MKKDAIAFIKVILLQLCYLYGHIHGTVSVTILGLNGLSLGYKGSRYAVTKPHIMNFYVLNAALPKLYNVRSPPNYPPTAWKIILLLSQPPLLSFILSRDTAFRTYINAVDGPSRCENAPKRGKRENGRLHPLMLSAVPETK